MQEAVRAKVVLRIWARGSYRSGVGIVEPETCAVNAAGKAVCLLSGFPGNALQCLGRIRGSIGRTFTVGLLVFALRSRGYLFALVIVDITAKFEVEIRLRSRSRRSSTIRSRVRLSRRDCVVRTGLERLKTTRGIGNYAEMASEWRADIRRTCLGINLLRSVIWWG